MARTPLTLAALATSAVPDLDVNSYAEYIDPDEDFAAALLDTDEGKLLVRIPRSERAEVRLSAEILSQTSLTDGLRAGLSFEVPRVLGMTRAGDTRAVVSTYLSGESLDLAALDSDLEFVRSVARMLAEIHGLPAAIVQEQGLPVRQALEVRAQCARLVDRAHASRLLPETVKARWDRVLESTGLWDFEPAVIHGSLAADLVLTDTSGLTAVTGWGDMAVADPATDFAWLFGAHPTVVDAVLTEYRSSRPGVDTADLKDRARFWHELELAQWLLHGLDHRDADIVEDATGLLDRLVERMRNESSTHAAGPLDEREVIELLEHTPSASDGLSDTAVYDALDEDRVFAPDADFLGEDEPHGDANEEDAPESDQDSDEARSDQRAESDAPRNPQD